jgi:hypothetical protein
VDIDRQAIERRDFPIARRGYEPAAVDAHLRAVASELEELERRRAAGSRSPLATAASSQVQSILQAAETAAADIERDAQQRADALREEADGDARRTREEALAKAREHAARVKQATNVLLERVGSLDGETSALLARLREGAERLARDLSALDANMGALYDAAAGEEVAPSVPSGRDSPAQLSERPPPAATVPAHEPLARAGPPAPVESPVRSPEARGPAAAVAPEAGNGDVDGARLVALNMALSGEPRASTVRYLAEHFQLSEREKLVDEVYAAIEA